MVVSDRQDLARSSDDRLSASDLERLAQLTSDGLCVVDRGGRVVRCNASFERRLGYPPQELRAHPLLDLVHPDDSRRALAAMAAFERGEASRSFTVRLRAQNGAWRALGINAVADPDCGSIYLIARELNAAGERLLATSQAEAREANGETMLEAVRHVQRLAIADCEPGPVFDYLLDQFLALTHSEHGFIAEAVEENGQRRLRTNAVANIAWNEDERRERGSGASADLELESLEHLFGDALAEGQGVLSNDLAAQAPEGATAGTHATLNAFAGIPLRDSEGLVGVLGLSNRPGGYEADLIEFLEPILATCGRLLRTYQVRRERNQASEELRRSEERWKRSVELAAYAVMVWDEKRTITYVNKSALDLLGYRRNDLLGRALDEILSDADLDHRASLERMRQDGWSHRVSHLRSATNENIPVELKAVDLGDGTFQAMIFDMREWVAIEDQLKRASQRDNLTGLLNRRAIEEHAEVEIHRARRRASSVSLLLIDIDHFKSINDRHGHLVGDAALQRVAEVISGCLRPTDWVGRWGGEEILVVLGETNETDAAMVGERVRKAVQESPLENPVTGRVDVTVSIGVASGSTGWIPSLRQFFERVDRAMYLAKQQGRNRVVCYQDSTLFRRFPALPDKR